MSDPVRRETSSEIGERFTSGVLQRLNRRVDPGGHMASRRGQRKCPSHSAGLDPSQGHARTLGRIYFGLRL